MPSVVLVIMGVTGSGKTTVALALHDLLGWDLGEGDDLHPAANIDKMAHGHPLTDEDRRPWLDRVHAWIHEHLAQGRNGIITCSALKRSYRDRLAEPGVVFVELHGSHDLLLDRLRRRQGHFMPPELLDSQLADLESPGPDEHAITVEDSASPDAQAAEIVRRLAL